MTRTDTCYMCDAPKTSREHAPPLCLFPEELVCGRDLRKNLITVPSCDTHNSLKSKDDEFLRTVLTIAAGRNAAGATLFFAKTLKAVRRRPEAFRPMFLDRGEVLECQGRVLKLDRSRLDCCIAHLVRAIIYHACRTKWLNPMVVFYSSLFSGIAGGKPVAHEPTEKMVEAIRQFLGSTPVRGDNPQVFKYRLRFDRDAEAFAFAGIFYDAFEVFAIPEIDELE
jgi:hypothetical protein